MKKVSARLSTKLVGKKDRLLTDEDARQEARDQGVSADEVPAITAERWVAAFRSGRWKALRNKVGEIVAVHLDKHSDLVYTISFDGALHQVPSNFFRIVEPYLGSSIGS